MTHPLSAPVHPPLYFLTSPLEVKSSLGILMTSVQTVILLRKLVKEFCTWKISSKVTDKAYIGTLLSCRNVRRLINVILGPFRRFYKG